jgi:hypothetical protein
MQDTLFVKMIVLIKAALKYKQKELSTHKTILLTYGMHTGHRLCYFGKKER